jgi:hypothetical protein
MVTISDPIIFGKHRATIRGASWDREGQFASIVFADETGAERTTRAEGMSAYELRKAVLDELIYSKWGRSARNGGAG